MQGARMMPEASIIHDGYGFRCAKRDLALPLALGETAARY
ncbi:N6-hydroxylysine O-acetyltransferase, aerobactin biosynthesis protein IucB @ Siderophore synthetase small component, acetyltransferase [Cronobacter turicensis 564]|nr:N6-hydroxylysine O-acetyltransferase, aerobactin biosynthesis protein IucB @ Siderophore synthetase small component, acetyltransferase [Cronobacter turicensis 564]